MAKRRRRKLESSEGAPPAGVSSHAAAGGLAGRMVWLIPVLAVLVYLNTMNAEFTYDDIDIIKKNETLRSTANIPELFTSTYWAGVQSAPDQSLYRPITMTTYALQYAIHGLRPGWFHVVNVALHALVCLVLFFAMREIFRNETVALVSGLIFAVHTIHTEAVAGVVGRAEILALLGILLCVWAYFRIMREPAGRAGGFFALSVAAYLMAMLSKEGGIVAPVIILMTEILIVGRRNLLRLRRRAVGLFVAYGLCAVLFLALRSHATLNRVVHTGWVGVSDPARIWTAFRVCMEYAGQVFLPIGLAADYWIVTIAESPIELTVLASLLLTVSCLFVIAWSSGKYPAVAWGLCFWGITLFPVSNIPFAIGVMKAERLLYAPSLGLIVTVSGLLALFASRTRAYRLVGVIVTVCVVALSVLTWRRNSVWQDDHALAAATLEVTPDSPTFNIALGLWHRGRGDDSQARMYYLRAIDILPNNKTSLFNLGNIELDQGNSEEAVSYYQRALIVEPDFADALNNLGQAYHQLGRYDRAVEMYKKYQQMVPDKPYAYMNLMVAYREKGDYDEALRVTEEALSRFPDVADIHFNAAAIYGDLGRDQEARRAHIRGQQLEASGDQP
jgi:Flp pilus assembly protein TadD